MNKRFQGFTIVELLVAIVVIGVLAAISIVSYTGISQKATQASLQSDLSSMVRQLKLSYVGTELYPTSSTCPSINPDDVCLKPSGNNSFQYTVSTNRKNYKLTATNGTSTSVVYGDSQIMAGTGIIPQTYYFRSDGVLDTSLAGSTPNNVISLSDYGGFFSANVNIKVEKWDTSWTEVSPQGTSAWNNFSYTTNTVNYYFPGASSSTNNLKIRITVYLTMQGVTTTGVFTSNDLGTKYLPSGTWGVIYSCGYINDTDYGPSENQPGTDVQFRYGSSVDSRITNFGGI